MELELETGLMWGWADSPVFGMGDAAEAQQISDLQLNGKRGVSLVLTIVLRSQTSRAAAACTKLINMSAKGLCCPLVGDHCAVYSMLPSA